MRDTDPTSRATSIEPEVLSRVAALVRTATRLADDAAGTDLRSPWLDVVAEAVSAGGYLTDVADPGGVDPASAQLDRDVVGPAGPQALKALQQAAGELDAAAGRRDHRVVLVRAALTDAILAARRIQS